MTLVKLILTAFLLIVSSQSLALFIPDNSQLDTEKIVASNNVGC